MRRSLLVKVGLRLRALSAAAVLLVQGCSMVPYYSQVKAVADTGIATAVEDRREFNDKKLAVNLVALCDSSIGAVNRHPNAEVRDFVNRLCGGDPQLSIEQLGRLASLLDQAANPGERIDLVMPEEPLP